MEKNEKIHRQMCLIIGGGKTIPRREKKNQEEQRAERGNYGYTWQVADS
jgi:hypothetical protein